MSPILLYTSPYFAKKLYVLRIKDPDPRFLSGLFFVTKFNGSDQIWIPNSGSSATLLFIKIYSFSQYGQSPLKLHDIYRHKIISLTMQKVGNKLFNMALCIFPIKRFFSTVRLYSAQSYLEVYSYVITFHRLFCFVNIFSKVFFCISMLL